MKIYNFEDLLKAAYQQPDAQRLLFVFASSELPDDCTDEQRARFELGMGGALVPLMEVDKLPDEIGGFDKLIEESTQFAGDHPARDWAIVFVGALAGQGQHPPSSADADEPLRRMAGAIREGTVHPFLAFDRQGQLVKLM